MYTHICVLTRVCIYLYLSIFLSLSIYLYIYIYISAEPGSMCRRATLRYVSEFRDRQRVGYVSFAWVGILRTLSSHFAICFLGEFPLRGFPFQNKLFETHIKYLKTLHILLFKGFHRVV